MSNDYIARWTGANAYGKELIVKEMVERIAVLEAALEPFSNAAAWYDDVLDGDDTVVGIHLGLCRAARTALRGAGAEETERA